MPDTVIEIYRLYLLRDPSLAEFAAAEDRIQAIGLDAYRAEVAGSAEAAELKGFFLPVVGLYQGLLDRAPEMEGLTYWVDAIRAGQESFQSLLSYFTASPEFNEKNPALGDNFGAEQLARVFYANLLGRAPDAEGLAFWTSLLENGGLTPQTFTASFVAAPETQGQIGSALRAYYADSRDGAIDDPANTGSLRDPDGVAGAIEWNVTVIDQAGIYDAAALVAAVEAAGGMWAPFLPGSGSIEVELVVTDVGGAIATGASLGAGRVTTADGGTALMDGALYELVSGVDVTGDAPDARISLSPYEVDFLWFDPNPFDDVRNVPFDKIDVVGTMAHELGHALYFNGYRGADGSGPGQSVFDALTVVTEDGLFFTGQRAQQVYGGPVPLADGSYAHYGNADGPGANLVDELMSTTAGYGRVDEVAALDAAMLADVIAFGSGITVA